MVLLYSHARKKEKETSDLISVLRECKGTLCFHRGIQYIFVAKMSSIADGKCTSFTRALSCPSTHEATICLGFKLFCIKAVIAKGHSGNDINKLVN